MKNFFNLLVNILTATTIFGSLCIQLYKCIPLLNNADIIYLPTPIRNISVAKPAFVKFIKNENPAELKYHLAISSFSGVPSSKDYVHYYTNISYNDLVNNKTLNFEVLNNNNLVWPNEINYVTSSLYNNTKQDVYGGLIVPGGFLVPSKSYGNILYYIFLNKDRSNVTLDPAIRLNSDDEEWFYHRVRLADVNSDGVPDLVTCRSFKSTFGQATVELIALVFNKITNVYDEYLIALNACDIFFEIDDLDGDGRIEIIAAGYFLSKLNIIYTNNKENNFLVPEDLVIKTIDNQAGKLFDVSIVDLDLQTNVNTNQKFKELLVTNHQSNKDSVKTSLFYYKLNGTNLRDGIWTRYLIYNDFPVLKSGINSAAPGVARAFSPNTAESQTKPPYIFVSGDCAEKAYLFKAKSTTTSDSPISYDLVWSHLFNDNTVGGISFADLNGDGYLEMALAIYERNLCIIYSFEPSGIYARKNNK